MDENVRGECVWARGFIRSHDAGRYGLSHLDAHVRLENELNSEGSVVVIEDTFRIWWWPRSIVWSAVRGMQLRA
jgi:hypothetical protein